MKQEIAKYTTDVASVGVVAATLVDLLPSIAALFTILWTSIRILETRTVRGWIQKWRRKE